VNAPQHVRAFVISPTLAGTGGYRPSADTDEPRLIEPGPDDGIGWLRVVDFGLAGLEPGRRARERGFMFWVMTSRLAKVFVRAMRDRSKRGSGSRRSETCRLISAASISRPRMATG
jgi:hypothetical protein